MVTYGQVTQFMQSQGLLTSEADWARYMPMWEEYLNDPQTTPEADLLTLHLRPTDYARLLTDRDQRVTTFFRFVRTLKRRSFGPVL